SISRPGWRTANACSSPSSSRPQHSRKASRSGSGRRRTRVRIGLSGELQGVVCKGCPPLEHLWEQFTEAVGELWLCPICLNARDLGEAEKVANRAVVGATPMWEWAGDDTTVLSY